MCGPYTQKKRKKDDKRTSELAFGCLAVYSVSDIEGTETVDRTRKKRYGQRIRKKMAKNIEVEGDNDSVDRTTQKN